MTLSELPPNFGEIFFGIFQSRGPLQVVESGGHPFEYAIGERCWRSLLLQRLGREKSCGGFGARNETLGWLFGTCRLHQKKAVAQLFFLNLPMTYHWNYVIMNIIKYIYIYTPRAPMTSIFEGQPSKTRHFFNQNKGHLSSRCLYIYISTFIHTQYVNIYIWNVT